MCYHIKNVFQSETVVFRWWTLLSRWNYLLVNSQLLPEVYGKVLLAKEYLASGEAASATQAAKMAGISRSAYYKYKDGVFEYDPENSEDMLTLSLKLTDEKGVLFAVTNELYVVGANVLSINQQVPQNGIASVALTVRIAEITVSVEKLIEKLKDVNGVRSVVIGGRV